MSGGGKNGEHRGAPRWCQTPLLALALLALVPVLAEASVPRAGVLVRGDIASVSSPLAALKESRTTDSGLVLFVGDEMESTTAADDPGANVQVLASRERELRLNLHRELELLSVEPLRGPPVADPKTQIGAFELSAPFRIGVSEQLSLNLQWACGLSGCELAEEHPKDPLGLAEKLSDSLYVPQGDIYTQHLAVKAEMNDPRNSVMARVGYSVLDAGVIPVAFAEEYVSRGLLNIPHLVAKTTEDASERVVEGITEKNAAKVSEGIGGYLFAFFHAGTVFTPWSSEFHSTPQISPRVPDAPEGLVLELEQKPIHNPKEFTRKVNRIENAVEGGDVASTTPHGVTDQARRALTRKYRRDVVARINSMYKNNPTARTKTATRNKCCNMMAEPV